MVSIIGFQKRTSQEGNEYFVIQLQSDEVELLISNKTRKPYATLKKCWLSTTFDEATCEMMIGKKMIGTIIKEACEPYSYFNEETGEEIFISFRNIYSPVESQESKVVGELVEA